MKLVVFFYFLFFHVFYIDMYYKYKSGCLKKPLRQNFHLVTLRKKMTHSLKLPLEKYTNYVKIMHLLSLNFTWNHTT